MWTDVSRGCGRWQARLAAMMSLALVALLAACGDQSITDPATPATSPLFSVNGGNLETGKVKVCKDNSNVPQGTAFTYEVSGTGTVTVQAGECKVVTSGGPPRQVTISENPKAGYTQVSVSRNSSGGGVQQVSDPASCSVSASDGCVVTYYNRKEIPTTYSGEATVVQASIFLGPTLNFVHAGPLPTTGGSDSKTLLTLGVPGILSAKFLNAKTQAGGSLSESYASIANIWLSVHGLTLTADIIDAKATAQCVNGQEKVEGQSYILKLVINGVPTIVQGTVNQTINLGLGKKIIINEQIESPNKDAITVNAIHVDLGPLANVIISSAHADIHCAK